MKYVTITSVCFLIFLNLGCKDKGVNPPDNNYPPGYQHNIPWPSLADAPSSINHADVQNTGRCNVIGPSSPSIKWKLEVEYGIYSGPVIDSEGNLYFGTDKFDADYFISVDKDGNLRWKYKTGSNFHNDGALAIDKDGTLYSGSYDGYLYAINSDGTLKWKAKLGLGKPLSVKSFSIDKEGNIYIMCGSDGYLYAVNPEGREIWKTKIDNGGIRSATSLSPDGKTIYIGSRNKNLYAISNIGEIKWTYKSNQTSIPSIDNQGNIYFCTSDDTLNFLVSLYPDGSERWKYTYGNTFGGTTSNGLAIDRLGNIYFQGYDTIAKKFAIISVDYSGKFRWSYILKETSSQGFNEEINQPLICDINGTLYFGSTWGIKYYSLSSNGELLWELPLNELEVDYTTAFGKDGTLYFGTNKTGGKPLLYAIK